MKRELFGMPISQKSKSEFFSATDLIKAGNKWRTDNGYDLFHLTTWIRSKGSKIFLEELEKDIGTSPIIRSRGKGHHTWVHPFLFIRIALSINPKLEIMVYKWLYDYLLMYRDLSGDSYIAMTGALYEISTNKSLFPNEIKEVARRIKKACGVTDWESASESQLKLRDNIQVRIETIALALRDSNVAIGTGIALALKEE